MDGDVNMVNPDFDIYLSLGVIVKGRTEALKRLIQFAEDDPDLTLVFTKTSGSKLRIVDIEEESKS